MLARASRAPARASRAAALLLQLAILRTLAEPRPRTLWSLRGGVEDFSLRRGRQGLAVVGNHLLDGSHVYPVVVGGSFILDATRAPEDGDNVTTLTDDEHLTTTTARLGFDEESTTTEASYVTTVVEDHDAPAKLARTRRRAGPGPGASKDAQAGAKAKMHKVSFTQMGYIQFLRYSVEVPDLHELSLCLWLRSKNITHSHPVFSYSRNERERLSRAWVSAGTPPRLHLRVLERDALPEPVPLPEASHRRWMHICLSWDSAGGRYDVYVDGKLRLSGRRAETSGLSLPGGGDVVVGQEYTDFDKGLDDGIEGEVFGFYLFRTASPSLASLAGAGQLLERRRYVLYSPPKGFMKRVPRRVQWLYALCTDQLEHEDREDAIVSWPSTPVRVFGGAIVSNILGPCGHF